MLFNSYANFALTPKSEAYVDRPAVRDKDTARKLGRMARAVAASMTLRRGESPHWIDYRVTLEGDLGETDVRVYFRGEVVPYTDECAYGRALARERARKALGVSGKFPVKSVKAIAWSPSIDDLMH